MATDFDLLGDPIPENWGKRGRPPHMATAEKRRLVIQLLAFDWSLEKIAAALNCSPPTLRKNYFRELKARAEARARVEAKLLNALMCQAEAGNVTAIDKYFKRLDRNDLDRLPRVKAPKPPKLGKKEAAMRDAHTAHEHTAWGELLN
ncbi:helix-turn-helix domain-containing protein [Rhodoligotrophos defluvii]|uniref:helix-turn-helix domain-containing protein n=1 Tax=Rhodoligotrophos defluvii TaxID=2561934 RepID=UPI0010C99080|nr:helix-turn-helix domain-containing protein [Rhodoligotrophos defluvii]